MITDSYSIKKICLLSWGLIGDVIVRAPIIEALKRQFPHALIDIVVDPSSKEVLAHHPDVDKIIVFSRKKDSRFRYLGRMLGKIHFLRQQKYDLCINFYSGGSSPLISRLSSARYRLGYNHKRSLRWSNNIQVDKPSFCGNWNRAYAKMLEPLGIDIESVKQGPSFYCSDAARFKAKELTSGMKGPFIGLNLGAGTDAKRWPIEKFLQLTEWINDEYGLRLLLFTNPGMEQLSEEFSRSFGSPNCLRKLPLLSLDEVGAVMELCSIIITADTSLMHMSFGLGKPTLVLFTSTRPEVVEPKTCLHADCFIEDSRHTDPCGNPLGTKEIPVSYVQEKFDMLFKETGLTRQIP